MRRRTWLSATVIGTALVGAGLGLHHLGGRAQDDTRPYAGSRECRDCHARFYELWSTSHHGRAMQPFTPDLASTELAPQIDAVEVDGVRYTAQWDGEKGWVLEEDEQGERRWPVEHVMGGKNVYFFLTPMDRGRLQVLPVAYNLHEKRWYDTTASMVRHAAGAPDEALRWTDSTLTFNTSCHGCHVSQLEVNYDEKTDSYHTTWVEPGINCETCHGPSAEHVRVARAAGPGQPLEDLRLISTKDLSVDQLNSSCAACHAKLSPISPGFRVGDTYFDHFDLAALEDRDFYPDGRDLGENYTMTGWHMSPCTKDGTFSCIHCHTSSGRYRFTEAAKANNACLPCHAARVKEASAHTHHAEGSEGSRCIDCHMPTTAFAQMRRSDHSMRPPSPAATAAFGSPNACNLCHADKDAAWAGGWLRTWKMNGHEERILEEGRLVQAAREQSWTALPEMLAYLDRGDRDEIVATALVRLLDACPDTRALPALARLVREDESPLVRSSSATSLSDNLTPETLPALIAATGDSVRLVRVRAAAALAGLPASTLPDADRQRLEAATAELERGLMSRRDDWANNYNLANLRMSRGDTPGAVAAYETAIRLRPDAVLPLVNVAMAYAEMGRQADARRALKQALEAEPKNAVAHFNMGLLEAELGDRQASERHLRSALEVDPTMAQAAYNLAMLLPDERQKETQELLRQAAELAPEDPRYAYALAFHLQQRGAGDEAARLLVGVLDQHPEYADAYLLLGELLERRGDTRAAQALYARGARQPGIPLPVRQQLMAKTRAAGPRK